MPLPGPALSARESPWPSRLVLGAMLAALAAIACAFFPKLPPQPLCQDRPAESAPPARPPTSPPRADAPFHDGAASGPKPRAPSEPFVQHRPECPREGVDACVYLGCGGADCLDALLAETDPVRRRYMRRLTDAAARRAQEVLARGENPGGVAHAELAMFCRTSGPCGGKDADGNAMDDGYACLTAAESSWDAGHTAWARKSQARACRCDPVRAQIPVMGGVLACDGPDRPVERGRELSLEVANEIRDCAECDPERGSAACAREGSRLQGVDPEQARYVEERVARCRQE
jgi:hypothetical protein